MILWLRDSAWIGCNRGWPSKGQRKIIWRKLAGLCFAFKLVQFIKLPSRTIFSMWFAKGGKKWTFLAVSGYPWYVALIVTYLWHSLSLEVILSFQMIAFERSCSFISWEVVTGVQRAVRVRKDDFLRSEQTFFLPHHLNYLQKYKIQKVKNATNKSTIYKNTRWHLEKWTNFPLALSHHPDFVQKYEIQQNKNAKIHFQKWTNLSAGYYLMINWPLGRHWN